MFDTIAAISTAAGMAAIGVVRVSGKDSVKILDSIFEPQSSFTDRKMYYGHIVYDNEVIDEVMVCVFYAPRSFTAEDMAEIYAHGGMYVLSRILDAVIKSGARHAKPGEFTERAFVNGRINMTEAEAVMDIISAKNDAARRHGVRQLGGSLTSRLTGIREKILTWIAHIELSIDYPEHEDEAKNAAVILKEAPNLLEDMSELLSTASVGRIIHSGIKTAIVGRPNVGKSTLLNSFLSENRAIVHEKPGTTRDVLTEEVRIGSLPIVLMDTAGIRKAADEVEFIGIERTYEAAADADLVLYIADATVGLTDEDIEIIRQLPDKKTLLLYNKTDLISGCRQMPEPSVNIDVPAVICGEINISAKTGFGMSGLFDGLEGMFLSGINSSMDIITRDRHRALIEEAHVLLARAVDELKRGVHEDLVSINLRLSYSKLGEILGVEIGDDIAEKIFSEFCVGK